MDDLDVQRFDSLCENYDFDSIVSIYEQEAFELVDFLFRETNRLRDLVLEARSKANYFAARDAEPPYPSIAEEVYNACFDNHPAMLQYFRLYDPCCFDALHLHF